MSIEIFANVTNTPAPISIGGLTISDIAAIAAIIISAVLFLFGYSRTRKSEQIRITRESMDRIGLKEQELRELMFLNMDTLFSVPENVRKMSKVDIYKKQAEQAKEVSNALTLTAKVIEEITYFEILIAYHEVRDKTILSFPALKILEILAQTQNSCKSLREWLESNKTINYFLVAGADGESFRKQRCEMLMGYENQISSHGGFWQPLSIWSGGRFSRLKKVFHG